MMNTSSSKTKSKTYTNRRYATVSSNETNSDDYDSSQYYHQQLFDNLTANVPSPSQWQPNKQIRYYNNQNQHQPSRQAQSSPKTSVEGSSVYTSQAQSLLTSKPHVTSGVQKQHQNKQYGHGGQHSGRRRNNDQTDKAGASQGKMQNNEVPVRVTEFTSEHLGALKATFDKILNEQFSSKVDLEQHMCIYHHLRDIILGKRPDALITLYGSLSFDCCLKETNIIDIDIQFNQTLPYETLKELLEIVRNSVYYKEARINIDREPLSIDLSILNSNTLVRLTSNYTRAIQLSQMVQIYTKFDERVLPLLRLFRSLSKTCNIDRPDLGTIHPIVFHLMVIHFLQQLDPPVLPCLHEYVFGIDKAPVALNNDQYTDFFQICSENVDRWKSKNMTNIEMLFLQLLSYYVQEFNIPRFIISIQTRMPLLKNEKQMFNRKLFCADPTSINRNLCYTMKASCSFKYFRDVLKAALNYFCQRPKDENLNKMIDDNDENILVKELIEIINKSYTLFIKRFPKKINHWKNLQQEDIRHYYKQTFNKIQNPLPEPILKLNENNTFQFLHENDDEEKIEETSRHDLEITSDMMDDNDDQNEDYQVAELDTTVIDHATNEEQVTMSQNELQSIGEEGKVVQKTHDNDNIGEEQVLFETLARDLNENQKEVLRKEYDQQVRIFNNKMQQILDDIKSSSNSLSIGETRLDESCSHSIKELIVSTTSVVPDKVEQTVTTNGTSLLNHSEFLYDIQAKHFGADKGAPSICTICYKNNHIKSDCPELSVPNIIDLPIIDREWINIVSRICRQVTDQCKPNKKDIKIREEILKYLQMEFEKCYPSCSVHAYGSSHNGFGFRQSDLDVCVILRDNNSEESNIIVLEKLSRIMESNPRMFKYVELVRDARVPIIRSIHSQFNIEIDISLHNILAMENTRLLKIYTEIDSRVSELGYMIKHLVKTCDIGDASSGTLSSYAYIIMVIHFLQQIHPSVLPVLQQLNDDPLKKTGMIRECNKWNVYFYDNLSKLKQVWVNKNGPNTLKTGELWIEFLRYYTEQFDYEKNVVTIRQYEPLRRYEKGWFHPSIAIEDPFVLTHNLADKLSLQKWSLIRRVFIRTRQEFCLQSEDIDIHQFKISWIQEYLFDIYTLCPENAEKLYKFARNPVVNNKAIQKPKSIVNRTENKQKPVMPLMQAPIVRKFSG